MTQPWLDLSADHPFGPQTLPWGVASRAGSETRFVAVRIGEHALDCASAARELGGIEETLARALGGGTLDALMDLGPGAWATARQWARGLLTDDERARQVAPFVHPLAELRMHLPFTVADYVDFYASEHHAMNVGKIFRPDSPALPAAWKHLPIGYHGRSGTVVVSGTDIVRPSGQRKGPGDAQPVFGPSIRLDIEAELGYVVAGGTTMGRAVGVDEAAEHIFGVVILNDWSARDIQAWEYVPLGPFLGKSFATSVSAWVTPLAALDAARVALPGQGDPRPLPYLTDGDAFGLDIRLEVELNGTVVSRPNNRDMYWSPAQMLAHLSVNGASLRTGDLFGSGTISGARKDERGSLLELSWNGTEPLQLQDGTVRGFLEDGDTVVMRAWAPGTDGARVGIAEVVGTIVAGTTATGTPVAGTVAGTATGTETT